MVPVKLRSYEMLEEENKELKNMMRKLCHEMGNALTLLGGSIFYLEHELQRNKTGEEVNNLKADYTYICKLFNNLREYNHTEAIDKENVEVTYLVNDIEEAFDKLNADNNMELKVEQAINTKDVCIYGDITKLRQMIINILKNSIEAMKENSEQKGKNIVIRVTVENIPEQSGVINDITSLIREVVHLEIRDNGKGIPEKNINEIFKPMYTLGKENGSGLGLAVVKKIVEDHRGKIKAVSVLGTGTAMHIYFPIVRNLV